MGLSCRVGQAQLPADRQQCCCRPWYGRRGVCGNACHRCLKPAVNAPASKLRQMRRTCFGCLWSVIPRQLGSEWPLCVTLCHLSSRPFLPSAAAAPLRGPSRRAGRRDRQFHRTGAGAGSTLRAGPFHRHGRGQRRFRMTPRRRWRASMDRLVDALEKHLGVVGRAQGVLVAVFGFSAAVKGTQPKASCSARPKPHMVPMIMSIVGSVPDPTAPRAAVPDD